MKHEIAPTEDTDMDITSAVVGIQQAKTLSAIQVKVAKKILDNQRSQGQAAVELLNSAAKNGSQAGDALVAAATGLGGEIDAYG